MTESKTMRQSLWALILALSLPVAGCASGPSWKEEVVMYDGSKAIVERQTILGNLLDQEFSDTRHGRPMKGNVLRAPVSESGWTGRWEAMGLNPQSINRVGGNWYLSATPMRCEGYDNWGRPVPPYVFFKYSGDEWQRITVDEFPAAITTRNLTYPGRSAEPGFVSAEKAKLLNPGLPDYVNNIYRSGTRGVDACREYLSVRDRTRGK